MKANEKAHRQAIIDACIWMNASGLNKGTAGNISTRQSDHILITPSGVPYDQMKSEQIARMPLEGEYGSFEGPLKPSSEWRFHLDIMKARPEIGAIIHTHSTFATVLACARKPIPAVHYMIAAAGGPTVRCADYATYGTKELSENVLKALDGRTGCLMANHGMIATGADLDKAKWFATELEGLAQQYYMTLSIGGPVILPDEEIFKNMELFKGYGANAQEPARIPPANKRRKT